MFSDSLDFAKKNHIFCRSNQMLKRFMESWSPIQWKDLEIHEILKNLSWIYSFVTQSYINPNIERLWS